MTLDGKVAAVTGASSGAAEAAALALAGQGATVALGARREDALRALAARIEDDGGRALALPVDVADERQARAFVEHVYEAFGRLDVLVCAASACADGRLEGADTEAWRQMVRVSLLGVVYCCHAALPVMRAQGFGHIVCVAGDVEGMARGGLVGFAEALREEVAPLGVRVSVAEDALVALA
jgi:NADP-dependent 3-hydroxy acid dehydrogenase YdfG